MKYIESTFGLNAALDFLDKTEALVEQISKFPKSCKASPSNPSIRMGKISKQNSLLYSPFSSHIEILHFWDNRQNPDTFEDLI